MEVEFLCGYVVVISYPSNIEELPGAIEKELLLKTSLLMPDIIEIKSYVREHMGEVAEAIREIKELV